MSFFNKKEEVLKIELTQYGKKLLSLGKFKPYCYRFFDDGILYDASAASTTEHQNESEDRIKLTPYSVLSPTATGIETRFDDEIINELIEGGAQSEKEKKKLLKYPLCKYKLGSSVAPAFQVSLLESEFSGSVKFVSEGGLGHRAPNIDIKMKNTVKKDFREIVERSEEEIEVLLSSPETEINIMELPVTYLDNSSLSLESEKLLMKFEELNSLYGNKNFEVEIYEVASYPGPEEILRKLETREEIEAFFEILTDEEIEDERIKKGEDSNKNFYMS